MFDKKKVKDIDYLAISARVRAKENYLLTAERMERMLEAKTDEEAFKVLAECGYEVGDMNPDALERLIAAERDRIFSDFGTSVTDTGMIDVFKIKYDYHNAKALLKGEAVGVEANYLLAPAGRIDPKRIGEAVLQNDYRALPGVLSGALAQAKEVLATTQDPQLADLILDKACYKEMRTIADSYDSAFLAGYVKILIDSINLKSTVRAMRMKKGADFLRSVLVEGGKVSPEGVASTVFGAGSIQTAFIGCGLDAASELGEAAVKGGRLTAFEKACDDAVTAYLRNSRYVAFGESVLIAYLAAKENELTAVRVILSGRLAGVSADAIRERLREAYV